MNNLSSDAVHSALTALHHVHVRDTSRLPLNAEQYCTAILPVADVCDDALQLQNKQPRHGARLILPSRPSRESSEPHIGPKWGANYRHAAPDNHQIDVRVLSIIVEHLQLDGIG
jgi:hypothetical protein